MSAESDRPVLRVIRGGASDEEIAALTVVLACVTGERRDGPHPAEPSAWADRAALLHAPRHPGPGAWRASAWPS